MATVQIEIVDGFDGLTDVINGMIGLANDADFSDTLDGFVPDIERIQADHFNNRSDPNGNPWPRTQWFRTGNNSHPTLEDTGRLRGSLIRGAADNITEISDRELTFGTGVEYANTHQEGAQVITDVPLVTEGGKGGYLPAGSQLNIPERPFVGMTEAAVTGFTEAVADDLVNIIRN